MADVARLAGVSYQTVSRVINDHPSVTATTRERVKLAILQLGYRPNTAARTLVTRQSRIFGLVSPDTAHFGPTSTIFAVAEAARAEGYFLNFVSLSEIDHPHMAAALSHLMDARVDGIVVLAPVDVAVEALGGLHPDPPVVVVAASQLSSPASVAVDQEAGARMATRHLLELGHRTVVHVSGPEDWLDARARIRGWRSELAAAGRVAYDVIAGDWTADSGHAAGAALLAAMRESRRDVTAVFVANDQMSLGLIRALREAGLRVPEDVSVVGFDDIPEARQFLPPLTTVRQDFGAIGRRCVATLVDKLGGREPDPLPPIQPDLIIRSSTARPRA